jgi:hypothetical protein
LKTFGRRYATRFVFTVAKTDCRYCGKAKPVIGKAVNWKRWSMLDCRYRGEVKPVIGKALGWKRSSSLDCPLWRQETFGRRYATRDAFGVFKPALKRGSTLDCRYRGKVKPVIGKALGWKRRSSLDCRYRDRSGSGPSKNSVAVLIDEIQHP